MGYRKILAVYRVNTPMFLSGCEQEKAELREASIKGALRFWFRATYDYKNLSDLKEAEQKLFGSSDTGQGKFLIRISKVDNMKKCKAGQEWRQAASAYLGYGLIKWDSKSKKVLTLRPFICPGAVFTVEIIFKPKPISTLEDVKAVKRSLIALGLFGGLGARSRHGFGSVSLESLVIDDKEEWVKPATKTELLTQMNKFTAELGLLSKELPEYSAFTKRSRIAIVLHRKNSLDLLNALGEEMMRYRSYGQVSKSGGEHKVLGIKAEQNFAGDHDLVLDFAKTGKASTHPARVVFGLPHNYFFSSFGGTKIDVNAENLNRRATPLLMHIHSLTNGYTAVLTLLPAVFLPDGEKIKLKLKQGNKKIVSSSVDTNVDYNVLNDFINRFHENERLEVTI